MKTYIAIGKLNFDFNFFTKINKNKAFQKEHSEKLVQSLHKNQQRNLILLF